MYKTDRSKAPTVVQGANECFIQGGGGGGAE